MKKIKLVLYSVLFLMIVVGLSPVLSLLLPEKLLDHTYREVGYKILTKRLTQGLVSDEDKALRVSEFLYDHLKTYVHPEGHDGKPFDHLRDGAAYCDYKANLLSALLAKENIRARYVFLLTKGGASSHSIAEVFLQGKWRFVDLLFGLSSRTVNGELATLADLTKDPDLLYEHPRAKALKATNKQLYEAWKTNYQRVIPVPRPPQTIGGAKADRQHILDYTASFYVDLFGSLYTRPFLEAYFWRKQKSFQGDEGQWAYFKARSYYIYGAFDEAYAGYDDIEKSYPSSKYAPRAMFYKAWSYLEDYHNVDMAIETLQRLLSKHQHAAAFELLAKAYEVKGLKGKALESYLKSSFDLQLDTAERMQKLTQSRPLK